MDQGDGSEIVRKEEEEELGLSGENLMYENLALKNELKWKESASTTMDIKDKTEKLILSLSQVQHELEMETRHLDELLVEHRKLEGHLADTENALFIAQ
nr:kinesin-like protein kin-12c [Quercus suber]